MPSKPILVRTTWDTAGWIKGSELGFDSVAKAEKVLGEGAFTVVSHQDGSPYEAPKAPPPANPKRMTRDQLNAYAAELGFPDPAGFQGTKAELLAAIEAYGADQGSPALADADTALGEG
jgi:hypothetical protein